MINKLNTIRDLIIAILLGIILWFFLASVDGFELLIEYLEAHEEYELDEVLLLIIILCPFLIGYSALRVKESMKINKQLNEINENLEIKIQKELQKRRDSELLLTQQSRFASLGEMISNIAHQWRQPLNALALNIQNLDFLYKNDQLTPELMDRSTKKIMLLTNNMSETIDDFRNFFRPEKSKSKFCLNESINKSINILDATLYETNITLIKSDLDESVCAFGYENEFCQVLVNVLNNSRDAYIENKIDNKVITIDFFKDEEFISIQIKDNAGGISNDLIHKIFDPYFTTKEKGTGIGLYMSKIIIEKNMNGYISVDNQDSGVLFTIKVPLFKEN